MSHVNRSELFSYMQDKATHYRQLRRARPVVHSIHQTVDHSPKRSRYLLERRVQRENEELLERLMSISDAKEGYLLKKGYLGRELPQPRAFLRIKKGEIEQRRSISIENERIRNSLKAPRPQIGTLEDWARQFRNSLLLKERISRHRNSTIEVNPELGTIREISSDCSAERMKVNQARLEKLFEQRVLRDLKAPKTTRP
jgi:hypothetical protein